MAKDGEDSIIPDLVGLMKQMILAQGRTNDRLDATIEAVNRLGERQVETIDAVGLLAKRQEETIAVVNVLAQGQRFLLDEVRGIREDLRVALAHEKRIVKLEEAVFKPGRPRRPSPRR